MQTFYLEKWKMYEAYYEKAAGQIFKKVCTEYKTIRIF